MNPPPSADRAVRQGAYDPTKAEQIFHRLENSRKELWRKLMLLTGVSRRKRRRRKRKKKTACFKPPSSPRRHLKALFSSLFGPYQSPVKPDEAHRSCPVHMGRRITVLSRTPLSTCPSRAILSTGYNACNAVGCHKPVRHLFTTCFRWFC